LTRTDILDAIHAGAPNTFILNGLCAYCLHCGAAAHAAAHPAAPLPLDVAPGVYLQDGGFYPLKHWEGLGSTWRHGRLQIAQLNVGRPPSPVYAETLTSGLSAHSGVHPDDLTSLPTETLSQSYASLPSTSTAQDLFTANTAHAVVPSSSETNDLFPSSSTHDTALDDLSTPAPYNGTLANFLNASHLPTPPHAAGHISVIDLEAATTVRSSDDITY
jgi:hypothetical protein